MARSDVGRAGRVADPKNAELFHLRPHPRLPDLENVEQLRQVSILSLLGPENVEQDLGSIFGRRRRSGAGSCA